MSVWLESRRPPTFWTFYCFHISDDTRAVWGFVLERPTNETVCEGRKLTHRKCTGNSCVTVVWCGGPEDEGVDRFRLAQNLNEIKKLLSFSQLKHKCAWAWSSSVVETIVAERLGFFHLFSFCSIQSKRPPKIRFHVLNIYEKTDKDRWIRSVVAKAMFIGDKTQLRLDKLIDQNCEVQFYFSSY